MIPITQLKRIGLRSLLAITFAWGVGIVVAPQAAHAGGTEPFIGEVVCGGWNFCPRYHAECNGQLLAINQNQALFSLIGTYYGGNGTTNFALPNIQGRTMVHQGQAPGLSNRILGAVGGTETVQLTTQQIPQHSHAVAAHTGSDKSASPAGRIPGPTPAAEAVYTPSSADSTLGAGAVENSGGSLPHNNRQPYLAVKCCIAINGIFPTRN